MEFIAFTILFFLIFLLKKDISSLKREISLLKSNREPLVHNMVSEKKVEQKVKPSDFLVSKEENPIIHSVSKIQKVEKVQQNRQIEYTPNILDKLVKIVVDYFSTGNIIVRIGGVVLFFGLAFLAKYATEHTVISIELRLFSIAIVAVVLVLLGWRLRDREGYYGIILQGIGIAVFYLVVFSTSKIYTVMPLGVAFIVMLCIVLVGVMLSVKQNALPLALFSIMYKIND